jgi:FkbM family methyltransferase
MAGFDVIRLWNSNENIDRHIKNVLDLNGVDCVIDVGANVGQYGSALRKHGFKGYIVSFEPVASCLHILKDVASKDEKWIIYPFALGEKDESKEINVFARSEFSSFHPVSEYATSTWDSLTAPKVEVVHVKRLDDLFEDIRQKTHGKAFYLKMDTQGHDKAVFFGAQKSLMEVVAMQSEISFVPVYEETALAPEMLEYFLKSGFTVSGMYPVNRDSKTLAIVEYDCVLVRKQSSITHPNDLSVHE